LIDTPLNGEGRRSLVILKKPASESFRRWADVSEVVENFTLESLKDTLEKGVPVVALLDPAVLYGGLQGFGHFVIIIGLEQNAIYYHDPDMGVELAKDIQLFFTAWGKFSFKGVTIWKSTKK
jgi:Papain-like cysteine protease AvrRpt2